MKADIFLLGIISIAVWGFVWYRSYRSSPLRWASPTCLFASGLLLFYIIPPLYWQFRPWNYSVPPYFEGLSLVLGSAGLVGLPFFLGALLSVGQKRNSQPIFQLRTEKFGRRLWVFLLPVLIGVWWRIYLLTLGHQARLSRKIPSLLGSESLALIVGNFSYYYAPCYFILVAFGNRRQRQVGIILWVMDGLFQIFLLHRYWIFLFILRSLIFVTLLGVKVRLRHWIVVGLFGVFVMAVIGQSHILTYDRVTDERSFLTIPKVAGVLQETSAGYARGVFQGGSSSDETNVLLRALDDTMYRLYDARSASAVMINVPDVIPYFYGKTLIHVFYSLVPRYFWPGKPSLIEIHKVTTWVMPNDSGWNPTGTLAEFYMNYGFLAVLIGGIACFFLCRGFDRLVKRKLIISPAWLCIYPILAEQFLFASSNFTRRICESIRGLVVLALIALLLSFAKRRVRRKVWDTAPGGSDVMDIAAREE